MFDAQLFGGGIEPILILLSSFAKGPNQPQSIYVCACERAIKNRAKCQPNEDEKWRDSTAILLLLLSPPKPQGTFSSRKKQAIAPLSGIIAPRGENKTHCNI
jgi:hypothetical protein